MSAADAVLCVPGLRDLRIKQEAPQQWRAMAEVNDEYFDGIGCTAEEACKAVLVDIRGDWR